jgi:hypothetical protein
MSAWEQVVWFGSRLPVCQATLHACEVRRGSPNLARDLIWGQTPISSFQRAHD